MTYTRDEQLAGIDFFHFGGSAFPDFDSTAINEFQETQLIKHRHQMRRRPGETTEQHWQRRKQSEATVLRNPLMMGFEPDFAVIEGRSSPAYSEMSATPVFDKRTVSFGPTSHDASPAIPQHDQLNSV